MRTKKPTMLEEILTRLDYFQFSLFKAVCRTYRYAKNSLNVSYSYTQGENITVSFWL
jgi:phosphoenolpyruvate carboxylase